MDNLLKQRLVGALILVALGVVFWPIIFVEPAQETAREEMQAPPRPRVDDTPIEPPDTVGLRSSPELQARRDQADEEQDVAAPMVMPIPGDPEPEKAESRRQEIAAQDSKLKSHATLPLRPAAAPIRGLVNTRESE